MNETNEKAREDQLRQYDIEARASITMLVNNASQQPKVANVFVVANARERIWLWNTLVQQCESTSMPPVPYIQMRSRDQVEFENGSTVRIMEFGRLDAMRGYRYDTVMFHQRILEEPIDNKKEYMAIWRAAARPA